MEDVDRKSGRRNRWLLIGQLIVILLAFLIANEVGPMVGKAPQPVASTYYPRAYVNITLKNTQLSPTQPNFDQLLKIDWSQYRSYIKSDISNVRFFNSTNFNTTSELPGWIEDNASVASPSSNVWVNLKDTIIPAQGSVNIYMLFLSINFSWDTYWGEASNLSKTYGVNDNGKNVFTFYDNFNGSELDGNWKFIRNNNGGISVHDGLTLTYPYYSSAGIISIKKYPAPQILEGKISIFDQQGMGGERLIESLSQSSAYSVSYYSGGFEQSYEYFSETNGDLLVVISPSYENTQLTNFTKLVNPDIRGIEWFSTGHEYGLMNDQYSGTPIANDSTWMMSDYYFGMNFGTGGATYGSSFISWIRSREPPPNNVMPETSLGQIYVVSTHEILADSFQTSMDSNSSSSAMQDYVIQDFA